MSIAHLPEYMVDFFQNDSDLYSSIELLQKKVGKRLFSKIQKDKDEINFYSWLSEMRTGLFFDKLFDQLKYEEHIEEKTPDWTLTSNGQKIIAETLRLNNMPEDKLRKKIEYIHECRKYNRENPGTYRWPASQAKVLDSAFYYGCQDKLVNKEKNYREIITKYKIPFIICAAPILDSFIGGFDTFDFLIGNQKKGFFYTDEYFGRNVTGVLLAGFFSGEYIYFSNEMAANKLNKKNSNLFGSIEYKT